jgi:predicted  nucleic acid-binding Zn-ribbon protein
MSETLLATQSLFTRYEGELKALEARQRAAEQTLKATEEQQRELSGRVAGLLADLKTAEGKVAEAQEHARQVTTNAERQAFGIVKAAQMDAEALRERMRLAILSAQRVYQELS